MTFDGTALVVGAGGGIGAATARRLAGDGARLVLVDILDARDRLEGAAESVRAAGGDPITVATDVSTVDGVEQVIAALPSDRLRAVVNAHGISPKADTKILDVPVEVFDRVIATNLRSVFLLCQATIPRLIDSGGGAIVNISSGAAFGGSGGTSYTSSKGGLNALTRAISFQYAAENVRCNTVCPGPVDTPMLKSSIEKLGERSVIRKFGVVPRVGTPEEVAALVSFLVSDDGSFVSGSAYSIDGGLSLH